MPAVDEQSVQALRSFLLVDPAKSARLLDSIQQSGGGQAYAAMLASAFTELVLVWFKSEDTFNVVIRFIAGMRAQFMEDIPGLDEVKPHVAEAMVLAVLGKPNRLHEFSEEDKATTQVWMTFALFLLAKKFITVDDFMSRTRDRAEKLLATGSMP